MSNIEAVISLFKRFNSSNVTLFTGVVLIAKRCQRKTTSAESKNIIILKSILPEEKRFRAILESEYYTISLPKTFAAKQHKLKGKF